jgi:bifunctional non-homologous end joining protein LigD
VLYAFDLLEHDGNGLRRLPLLERKRRLARLLGWAKRPSIQFVEQANVNRVEFSFGAGGLPRSC